METTKIVYDLVIQPFNYSAVFGSMLGLALIVLLENLSTNAVTFVKGWRT